MICERSLGELLDALGAQTPAPGGGTAAAVAGALAAALVEMATRFTLGREASSEVHERMTEILGRAGELREQLVALAEVEEHAYEPVLAALRLSRDDPARAERLAAARSEAARSPLGIARATEEVAALASELVRTGNPNLEGDALAGRILAEAACRAAARLVELNLPDGEADPRVREALQLAERAREPPD